MSVPSPDQTLVLAAIRRFLDEPAPPVAPDRHGSPDRLDAIVDALAQLLPPGEIEQAVTGLLSRHCDDLDDDTQLVLEAVLGAIERDDRELELEKLLAREASLLEANALECGVLLVWDPAVSTTLLEMEIPDLLERYPCRGEGARWSCEDFVALLEGKALEWRRTRVALEILQEHPGSRPAASTMVLVVPEDTGSPLEQLEVAISLGPRG